MPGPASAQDEPGGGGSAGKCTTALAEYCVGAWDDSRQPGSSGGGDSGGKQPAGGSGGSDDESGISTCITKPMDPQPPAGSDYWDGHDPSDGKVYITECLSGRGRWGSPGTLDIFFSAQEPEEDEPAIDPAVLAQQAIDSMLLKGPAIGIVPEPGKTGLLGMPVWMWTETGPSTYGPTSATASAGDVTVTATARVSKIVWEMGDGSTVTCESAGTPYKSSYGKRKSPDCGHLYEESSAGEPGGEFTVTATSTWAIEWEGGGESGTDSEVRTSEVQIQVGEAQVVG